MNTYPETLTPEELQLEADRLATARDDRTYVLQDLQRRRPQIDLYERYYEGDHRLAFATAKFREAFAHLFSTFALNFCAPVVDATADRLQVEGFTLTTAAAQASAAGDTDPAGNAARDGREAAVRALQDRARAIWDRNQMDKRAGEAHLEALLNGDGFVIVWRHPERQAEPVIWPQLAREVAVRYSDELPDVIEMAGKAWLEAGKARINLYYPDRIERYVSRTNVRNLPRDGADFEEFDAPEPNPYGITPVFHLGNNARTNSMGRSELVKAIPVQDALNKAVLDMMVAMEFHALPQRWATGIEPVSPAPADAATGRAPLRFRPGGVWSSAAKDARFGEFAAGDMKGFLDVQRELKADIARMTSTPLHVLMLTSDQAPSGEALKTAETPLTKKVEDRQKAFGPDWAAVMSLALQISGAGRHELMTMWATASPRTERETAEVGILKEDLGISQRQALREAGYSDEEIDRMEAEKAEEPSTIGGALLDRAFNRGNAP